MVTDLGGPLDDILEHAGLALAQFEQPTLLIPFDQQIRLLQVAADRCRCEHFSLELARRQNIAVFGALSLLAMQCPTVHAGLMIYDRYLHYSVQGVEVKLDTRGKQSRFTIDTSLEGAAASAQFWDHGAALGFLVVRMLCGDDWRPSSISLRRPQPNDADYYRRYFGCPVIFDSPVSELVFDGSVLDFPIGDSANAVPLQLHQYLRSSFAGDFLEQMRRVIISLLSTGDCNAKMVAQCMGYSLRTMQRKLLQERTSFQQQIDRIRSELAINYIEQHQFSFTDIGGLLGFAELSIFTRSFKRWFGVTPSQWRTRRFSYQ
ncbi:MAG: AraC family transcriptional regulator [Halioglobus sp.]